MIFYFENDMRVYSRESFRGLLRGDKYVKVLIQHVLVLSISNCYVLVDFILGCKPETIFKA